MAKIDNGGPAFPHVEQTDGTTDKIAPGMGLRDWFAGHALAGMLAARVTDTDRDKPKDQDWYAAPILVMCDGEVSLDHAAYAGQYAGLAYRMADAMLAARAPTTPQPEEPR